MLRQNKQFEYDKGVLGNCDVHFFDIFLILMDQINLMEKVADI